MSEEYFLSPQDKQSLQRWHAWLDDNRGDRARLRRAERPDDLLLTAAFFHFFTQMPERWQQDKELLTSASIAGALSHVKINKQSPSRVYGSKEKGARRKMASFAEQLATPMEGNSKSPMSELRFQQLQKSRSTEDFYRRVIGAIRLLHCNVNIISLANDISHWHQEFDKPLGRRPSKRLAVRWATDYFTALPKNSY